MHGPEDHQGLISEADAQTRNSEVDAQNMILHGVDAQVTIIPPGDRLHRVLEIPPGETVHPMEQNVIKVHHINAEQTRLMLLGYDISG